MLQCGSCNIRFMCDQQPHCKGTIAGQLDRCGPIWAATTSSACFALHQNWQTLIHREMYVGLQCFLVLTWNAFLNYRMEPVVKSILGSLITIRLVALHMEHNPNVFFNHGLIDLGHKYHGDWTWNNCQVMLSTLFCMIFVYRLGFRCTNCEPNPQFLESLTKFS
jgi:hypothetical protein